MFVSLKSFAESGKLAGLAIPYIIHSDTFNKNIEKDHFKISGFIYERYTNSAVNNALIADSTEQFNTRSKENGYFELTLPCTVPKTYFYKDSCEELIISNSIFKSQHDIRLDVYLNHLHKIVVVAKPVIYLYNTPSQIDLTVKAKGELSFTYPGEEASWRVTANHLGQIHNLDNGQKYPYLFWEATRQELDFDLTNNEFNGYFIKTDTCINFLHQILTELNLNNREKSDFITFWGPKMMHKDYAMVQFLFNKDYHDKIAELNLNKRPENALRIFMIFLPLDKEPKNLQCSPAKMPTFKREGFQLLEWGGAQLLNSNYLEI